jgi:hypothetical protein
MGLLDGIVGDLLGNLPGAARQAPGTGGTDGGNSVLTALLPIVLGMLMNRQGGAATGAEGGGGLSDVLGGMLGGARGSQGGGLGDVLGGMLGGAGGTGGAWVLFWAVCLVVERVVRAALVGWVPCWSSFSARVLPSRPTRGSERGRTFPSRLARSVRSSAAIPWRRSPSRWALPRLRQPKVCRNSCPKSWIASRRRARRRTSINSRPASLP